MKIQRGYFFASSATQKATLIVSQPNRKSAFCITDNKRTDHSFEKGIANQHLSFCYKYNAILQHVLPRSEMKFQASSHLLWLYCPVFFFRTGWKFNKAPCIKTAKIQLSCCTRKLTICICKNKGADQLCSNCTADQRLCFHYTDSTIALLLKSEISSF